MYLGRYWYAPWKRKLKMNWDYKCSEPVYNSLANAHKKLAQATHGAPLITPTWSVLKNIITPHPLGGCGMGEDDKTAVVDHRCEVFNYPGLYVMDGSIIPQSLGFNPARTIAALSERGAQIMLEEEKSSNE